MSEYTNWHDGRAVLFAVAELLLSFATDVMLYSAFVCFFSFCLSASNFMLTTDRIFMKILSQMYLGNFGNHPDRGFV